MPPDVPSAAAPSPAELPVSAAAQPPQVEPTCGRHEGDQPLGSGRDEGASAACAATPNEAEAERVARVRALLVEAQEGALPSRLNPQIGFRLRGAEQRALLDALARHAVRWTLDDLEAVLVFGAFSGHAVSLVVAHPAATPAFWSWIAQAATSPTHLLPLARHAPARLVPPIRRALRACRDPHVLTNLAIDAEDVEFDELVADIARLDPRAAIRVLEDPRHAHRLPGLPAAAIAPLTACDDVSVRLALLRIFRPFMPDPVEPSSRPQALDLGRRR